MDPCSSYGLIVIGTMPHQVDTPTAEVVNVFFDKKIFEKLLKLSIMFGGKWNNAIKLLAVRNIG